MNATEVRQLADTWLAHRPRDRRGLPVPWINHWGEERGDLIRIAHDPHVKSRAAFLDEYGDIPDFTRQNMGRQRQAMNEGLCQVCARPVPWSRRNLVVSGSTVDWIMWNGRRTGAVIEPWLDDRCADIAIGWCPALIRQDRFTHLTRLRITSKRDVTLIVSTGWVEGPHEAETRRRPVAMWVKALLHTLDLRPKVVAR